MTNVKMTKVEKFGMILEVVREMEFAGFDVVDFLENEIEMVNKRNASKSANRKPSKAQQENETFVTEILDLLESRKGEMLSAKEINDALGWDFTSQKMTALMKKTLELGVAKDKADSDKKKVGYGFTE